MPQVGLVARNSSTLCLTAPPATGWSLGRISEFSLGPDVGAPYYAENAGILNAKMDERTRRSDDELAPNLRRTTPEPDVISRPSSKWRVGLGLVIAIGLVVAAYVVGRITRAPPPANPRFAAGGLQSVGAATIAPGNIRVIVNALGTVTPLATVTVQTQISGQ